MRPLVLIAGIAVIALLAFAAGLATGLSLGGPAPAAVPSAPLSVPPAVPPAATSDAAPPPGQAKPAEAAPPATTAATATAAPAAAAPAGPPPVAARFLPPLPVAPLPPPLDPEPGKEPAVPRIPALGPPPADAETALAVQKTTAQPPEDQAATGPAYVVEVAAFRNAANAAGLVAELTSQGFQPQLYRLDGGWLAVALGRYPSPQAAEPMIARLYDATGRRGRAVLMVEQPKDGVKS